MTRFSTPFTSCCDTTTPILRLPLCVVVTNIVFALVLLAAGCSSSSSDTTAETSIPTTTSTDAPTTTQATSVETTDPEPSVTTTPPAEWTPEELEVIEAYDDFETVFVSVLVDETASPDVLGAVASEKLAAALAANVEADRANGTVYEGTIEALPAAIRWLDDETVELDLCLWDQVIRSETNGEAGAADPAPMLRTNLMVKQGGEWRMDGLISDEAVLETCEL